MANFTTDTERSQILTMKNLGIASSIIARIVGVDRTTVNRIYCRYLKPRATYLTALCTGRPRKMTARDDQRVVMGLAKLRRGNAAELQREYFPDLHPDTIRRHLQELGLVARRRRKVPCLTYKQIKARCGRSADHLSWNTIRWAWVIFSDESKFNLFSSDGAEYIWRRPRQAYNPRYTAKTVKHGGGHVMVWGCITYRGVGRLYRIDGIMNAAKYTEILKDALAGTLNDQKLRPKNVIFQSDNGPKHKSKLASDWLNSKHIDVLPWPSNSPDMKIIEHVWSYLDRKVGARTLRPRNEDELWHALKEEWDNIDELVIKNHHHSMPRRVSELYNKKGGSTRY